MRIIEIKKHHLNLYYKKGVLSKNFHWGGKDEYQSENLIENDDSRRYRILTYPEFVTSYRNNLLKHAEDEVRALAKKLSNDKKHMSNGIPPIPPVPQAVRDAVNNGTLAVFIGAGVSRLVECLGWDELARNLVNRCHKENIINFKEQETLSQIQDHKKTITICYHLFNNNYRKEVFYEEMKRALREGADIGIPNIYDDIYKLRGLFITTNADTHFDRLFNSPNILFQPADFKHNRLDRTNLYHIHGSITDSASLVFTVSGYMGRYAQPDFQRFLERIFKEYTVLFLGYGVSEFEVLDFILQRKSRNSTEEPRHFILSPFYSSEENILSYEQAYYNDLGITVLPYEKDKSGYRQLIEVVKRWNAEINQVTDYQHQAFRSIDDAVERASVDDVNKTLQWIKNDKNLENYFFKKIAASAKPLAWLPHLNDTRYFAPNNNPRPQEVPNKKGYFAVPHWNILDALENMAIKNAESPDKKVTKVLLDIINGIATYRDENEERIDNYRTDWMMLKIISNFPMKHIESKHIQFVKESLHSKIGYSLVGSEIGKMFLPKLITGGAKDRILELLDVILHYYRKAEREYLSVIDPYDLKEILNKNKAGVAGICGVVAAEIALDKIKEIIAEDKSQFNYIWIPTIEDHKQTTFSGRYECQLVHFIRDMLELSKPSEFKKIIQQLLKEEHPIYKRLAFHLINYHYDALADLFWCIPINPLDILSTHEIYELLKVHCTKFTEEQIKTVLNWVETQHLDMPDDILSDSDRKQKMRAYYKKEWLSALLETRHKEIIRMYETYNAINPAQIEHPGFHYWSECGFVQEVSPIAEEELKQKTNSEIVNYINTYREESESGWRGLTHVNLSNSIRQFAANDPARFAHDLDPFLLVSRKYQHAILSGLEEAWRNNKDFDWSDLLPFMQKIVKEDAFWDEEKKYDKYDYNRWIIGTMADLVQEGTKDDKHAFSPKLLPCAEQIILILLKNAKNDMSMISDLVTSVLNSTKGKVFMAAINYSLRYARLHCCGKEERWVDSIKSEFTERLDRVKEPRIEFSVVLGEYLPNLNYLDKKWVTSNINKIFLIEDDDHWKAAFIGYVVMTSTVYEDIYKLLRKNGHYEKGLSCSFEDKHAEDKLVQHIAIGYLAGWDNLDDSDGLISKLFQIGSVAHISKLVSFLLTFRDKDDKELRNKIKPLWKVVIEKIKPNLGMDEYKVIASDLGRWLSLVDLIDDEVYEWLKYSVKSIEENWNGPFFIEYLLKHAKQTPEKVGNLYVEMLNANVYPIYKQEHIVEIVKILYKHNCKEIADRICNLYYSKGYEFLRPIYEENHTS